MEYERKFLLKEFPADMDVREAQNIVQAYVSGPNDDSEVRVRSTTMGSVAVYSMTVKTGEGASRSETEVKLSSTNFDSFVTNSDNIIRKIRLRFFFVTPNLYADVDIYQNQLVGLRTVEVEFQTPESMANFVPPAWFGQEVTGISEFSNSNLNTLAWKDYQFPVA